MILKPTKFKTFNKEVYGFDIETYNNNKSFYCASIVGKDYEKIFFSKGDFIETIKNRRFENTYMVASNLLFDFFGIFFGNYYMNKFDTLFRGTDLLLAKTYLRKNDFHRTPSKSNKRHILFLDTLNYAHLSVEKLGNIINLHKLKTPSFIGKKPKNQKQINQLVKYNIRDSRVSREALLFLFNSFQKLGANCKNTIASTSMSLWRNKYQTENYFSHTEGELLEMFQGYYGGRTEAFLRGKIEDVYDYDINSLYPYVMQKYEYPHPNSLRRNRINTLDYLYNYEGFTYCCLLSPRKQYPLIPLRTKDKLLFPVGEFKGFYSNVELREALKYGYKIKKVYKNIYFKETCKPFEKFVKDLFELRKKYKLDNNSMEYVIKIVLNSLYGKFGQRFDNKENWIPIPEEHEDIIKHTILDFKGNFMRVKGKVKPTVYCFPEWASYVSAYGRLELYNLIQQTHPYYCDTDSIFTSKKMPTSDAIGKLKLEMKIEEGIIVKPKMYAIKGSEGEYVKAKGVGVKFVYNEFIKHFLGNPKITYKKFVKFKEALRRDLIPNEIIDISKDLDLEDNKRYWSKPFSRYELQSSTPIDINESINIYKPLPVITY